MAFGHRRLARALAAACAVVASSAGVLRGRRRRSDQLRRRRHADHHNTNTVGRAASGGPQASRPVLTGFTFHGPDGQVLADHDFGTVSVVGREPLVLDYQIADDAVYSDGKPITCDDMVLAWAAQLRPVSG